MAQVCQVIQADPDTLAAELTTLAATNEIKLIVKTKSAGKFLVVSDDAGSTAQIISVISGDPEKLADELDAIIATPYTLEIVSETFSAAHYVAVYK